MTEPIWQTDVDAEGINRLHRETAVAALGIEFTEVGPDYMRARMPVDARTVQPYGLLHGGASALLAETLASCAAAHAAPAGRRVVGIEISASHLRGVRRGGQVTGLATPHHLGGTLQVWQVEIVDDAGKPCCVARVSLMTLDPAAR